MIQIKFANRVKSILEDDDNIIGLAVSGSWITNEIEKKINQKSNTDK